MKTKLLCAFIFIWAFGTARAATYYISPTGSDAAAGTSVTTPWKTFAFVIPKLKPGDNLILLDGSYTDANSGFPFLNNVNGTAAQPITIKAQNERRAHIHNNGTTNSVAALNCSYLVFEGLQLSSADNASITWTNGKNEGRALYLYQCHHITMKRLLCHHNNRYGNNTLAALVKVNNSLMEDCEFYYHHRHAVATKPGEGNVFRRIYCNSRGYGTIANGYPNGHGSIGGDQCISCYPAKSTIIENSIAEGHSQGIFDVMASGEVAADSNKFLGNIAMETQFGINIKARGDNGATGPLYMPKYNTVKDLVVLNSEATGVSLRGTKGQRLINATVLNCAGKGVSADVSTTERGDGVYSLFTENVLSANNKLEGFYVAPTIQTWSMDHPNFYGNTPNCYPTVSANYFSPLTIDPKLGTCKVYIPDGSPMKRAGKNGADIGANILYRYQDGVLTNQPLWDARTGEFPRGAIIAGINDIPGQSLFDVHKRLNVNCNGCPFPAGYASTKIVGRGSFDVGRKPITIRKTGAGIIIRSPGVPASAATIYSLNGKEIASYRNIGAQGTVWNPNKSASGVYLVKVESGNVTQTAKVFCGR